MESPDTWDLLTASLAVSDLSEPDIAWAFLVMQGLVRNQPDDLRKFKELLRSEEEKGPITGPSLPARVASALSTLGITQSEFNRADPNAMTARERIKIVNSWRE